MATIVERPRKNKPSTWQATIRVKGQTSVVKTFEQRCDAEDFSKIIEAKLKKLAEERSKKMKRLDKKQATLAGLMDERLRDIVQAFCESDESIPRHKKTAPTILRVIGNITLKDVTPLWNKNYIARMLTKKTRIGTTFSYSTIAVHLQIMSMACRWRAETLNLPTQQLNFSKKHFPKHWENRRTRRLSEPEQLRLEAVLKACKAPSRNQWFHLMQMALETGARLQELVLAEWDEFDLDRRLWTIPAIKTKGRKVRAVPLSFKAIAFMQNLQQEAVAGNSRVFHLLGLPLSVSSGFHKFVTRAGLIDFRFHDLRHEAISRMVLYKRKLSVFEIMAIVGHSDVSMLVRYANLRGDELAERMD